jgi:hypothetical protein
MPNARMLLIAGLLFFGSCSAQTESSDIRAPQIEVELRADTTADSVSGVRVVIANEDSDFAVCLPANGLPEEANLDHFFAVTSSEREAVTFAGPRSNLHPIIPTVVYIRPGHRIETFAPLSAAFPGALQPGSCIALRLDYFNCRSLERWDFNGPPGPQPGKGRHESHWSVDDSGELTPLPSAQSCRMEP